MKSIVIGQFAPVEQRKKEEEKRGRNWRTREEISNLAFVSEVLSARRPPLSDVCMRANC